MVEITESILNETESDIDRQWRNIEFCYEIADQHREMEKYINECVIKASGNKRAINEMYVINEAAIGDKIKAFFTKIKDFFKKIFTKLGASLNGLFMEQKKYIDKYAGIITKCKWNCGDVTDIKDRFKGVPRIIEISDNAETTAIGTNLDKYFKGDKVPGTSEIDASTFQSANSIENAYKDEKMKTKIENGAGRDEMFNEFTGNDTYWGKLKDFASYKSTDSNGVVDVNKTFTDWFDGSTDTISYSGDEIENNFQTVINVTYAGQSYMNKFEKIVNAVAKKMDDASKTMENYHKAQKDKIMQAVKGTAATQTPQSGTSGQGGETSEQAAERQAATNVDKAAKTSSENDQNAEAFGMLNSKNNNGTSVNLSSTSLIRNYNDRYFNELGISNNGGGATTATSDPNGTNSAKVEKGTGSQQVNNASKSAENVNKMQTNKMTAKDVNNTTGVNDNNRDDLAKKAEELLDVDIYNRQVRINESINISSTIVRSAFNSFKATNNDFFQLIKAHVQWYLSNPGAEKNAENASKTAKNLNMNAGNAAVGKQVSTSESKPTPKPTQNPNPAPERQD